MDLANWALRTSPKFTTGVKYQLVPFDQIKDQELLVSHEAPPQVADRGTLTRSGGYRGNKIPGADQNQHC